MSTTAAPASGTDWLQVVRDLGPRFAERAAEHDANDTFVAQNYAELKERGLFSAGVPAELGGGGASHAQLCAVIRELARHCSSTGLALSMHTHLVATLAYLWRAGNKGPEGMLKRVAAEGLVLISTGGSDWLPGSGKLEKVEGGYRLTGRKIFGSGVPAGDVFMTTGVYDDPEKGPTVFHIPVPVKSPGVTVLDTWRTLGMRGTGSNDVMLENVFVPEAATGGVKRPAGKWHPFMHTVVLAAVPVFYAAYMGVAEAAAAVALEMGKKRLARSGDPGLPYLVGEMENQLTTARLAFESMVDLTSKAQAGAESTSAVLARRTILAKAALATVDKAMEVAGGGSFYRNVPLERMFRDIQGARFHPLPEKPQTLLTGRFLLGQSIDG